MSDFTIDELSAESVEVLPAREEMIFGVLGVARYVLCQSPIVDGGVNALGRTVYLGVF